MDRPINRVAVIGTGVIGASWTALFLAKGLHVDVTDVAPGAADRLRETSRRRGRRSNNGGTPTLDADVTKRIPDDVAVEAGDRSSSQLAARRDALLLGLLRLREGEAGAAR